jgi:hypothetical protein
MKINFYQMNNHALMRCRRMLGLGHSPLVLSSVKSTCFSTSTGARKSLPESTQMDHGQMVSARQCKLFT